MYRKWLAIGSVLTLMGCSVFGNMTATPAATAETIQASYVLAVNAELAYVNTAKPSAATLAKIKGCDQTAYAVIKPVSDALVAGIAPTTVLVTAAASAITNLQACLNPLGVKF